MECKGNIGMESAGGTGVAEQIGGGCRVLVVAVIVVVEAMNGMSADVEEKK